MNKLFTLAFAVALTPLSQKNSIADFTSVDNTQRQDVAFHFNNKVGVNFWEPEKKPADAWSQNWMNAAQENIRKSEYHFKWEEKYKAYCTPNRKNNLRFFYNEKGFVVEPRTTQIPIGYYDPMKRPDEIKYKSIPNWKVKFNLDKRQVGKGFWNITDNKAEYIADKITVQYINSDEGMRQNFIVHSPLSKKNTLKINFSIKTKLKTYLHGNQLQFFHKKTNVLNYEDLKVWDASGKALTASFQKRKKGNFYIQVDAKDAVYPITIDPLSTTPNAQLESNQAGARMGFSVSGAGDVNGDGYGDVVVGVHAYDNPEGDEGAAFVYHGSATGINISPAVILENNQPVARLGLSVSTAGDVNGDGYSDIIVGTAHYDNGEMDEGAFLVYHGSASGIVATPATFVESNQVNAQLGYSVACAGDVNGDGYSDVVVGAWLYDNPEVNEGAAFVYYGGPAGITISGNSIVQADQGAANFGMSVSGAGDVNGDGYSDIIVGAEDFDDGQTDEGAVFIYHGSAGGLVTTAAVMLQENLTLSQYGFSVSGAGDVNGDGYSDVIVGAYLYSNGQANEGVAFVYHGSAAGIGNVYSVLLEANQIAAGYGVSVACAGDINGDGYSDVIVGANSYDNGESNEGAAFVYSGSSTGINPVAVAILEINQAGADMGRAVRGAGDVNGDGYSDVIVGAQLYDNGQNDEGGAFVYHGSAAGINTTAVATVESNQADAQMGYSVASAGDVNGDGYSDVIVGAYYYDNGQTDEGRAFVYHGSAIGINTTAAATVESNQASAILGYSVACAGDVNGDGYSDVIAGALGYSNGQLGEGAVFVYNGSASGINTTAAAILESNLASTGMGWSVAGAGDINGDGYSDVIAGATSYSNGQSGEGAAFIYHGSAAGISATAAVILESNQVIARLGFSVAGAGDVNGDGYSDVIVGADQYDNGNTNEGAAFVFHGSATGINTTAAAIMESSQDFAFLGCSVAGAGDVNGDGYSDVIVGADQYDNGNINEGSAFIYHGSASGINTTAATTMESNQDAARMGNSVACAGDVNGDGYSDVVIGAWLFDNGQTDEGRAYIYHGSVTGINTTVAAIVESNQTDAGLGRSVACAGDVNGDGYSDVIVGAHGYDSGQADEGAAFVYHGNSPGINKRNNLRLYNQDLATPISHVNVTEPNLFGAGLFAKSSLGKVKGKLVWEVKSESGAFSGNPITNSTAYLDKQTSFTDLGLAGTELKSNVQKVGSKNNKIRTRVEYDKVTAITGQVYGPWRYPAGYTMGAYGMNSVPLPITLISFNGQFINADDVRLKWITTNELDMQSYFVERSTDGINFTAIGELMAKGIGSMRSDYSFTDKHVQHNLLYYRLRLKEKNGELTYTKTITLSRSKAAKSFIVPNPVMDVLTLQLNNVYDKLNIQLVNTAGQIVKQFNSIPVSNQTITIPVSNLPAGQYWLYFQSGNDKQVLQFVKQ